MWRLVADLRNNVSGSRLSLKLVVILVVIAVPSFKLLYYSDVIPKADMTIARFGAN